MQISALNGIITLTYYTLRKNRCLKGSSLVPYMEPLRVLKEPLKVPGEPLRVPRMVLGFS